MAERFPNIDWYCDKCNSYLNSQKNFNDHKYIWKCTNCGHKNSISKDNIIYGQSKFVSVLGFFLGYLRTMSLYLLPFTYGISVAGYLFLAVLSALFEHFIAHYRQGEKHWLIKNLYENILSDLFRPFVEVWYAILAILFFFLDRSIFYLLKHIVYGFFYSVPLLLLFYFLNIVIGIF